MKTKSVSKRVLALLCLSFILTGCTKESECNIKDKHLHLYTKKKYGATIQTYLDSEYLEYNGYNWTDETISLTKNDDDKFYEAKQDLFYGPDNWEYLYKFMTSKSDRLEFYYYYTEDGVISMVDTDGNITDMPYTDTYSGWTTDPRYRGVTGEVRVVHNRFTGNRFVYKDGEYKRERSYAVDDIRDIIDKYPYFEEDGSVEIYDKYNFDSAKLPYLKLEDLDSFKGPDFSTKEMHPKAK